MTFHQQYHDPSLLAYDPYHFTNQPMEYQNSQESLQALTLPTDEIFKTSTWNPSNLLKNDMDVEDIGQPERGIAGFVSKLYQCLQAPDDSQKYARWCRHNGTDMFIIDCIPKFTEIVLPRLFKHCKFASFVRQLNIYGFQRDTDARKSKDSRDKETCRWYHIHFRPGRRDLFHLIRRKTPRYSRRKRVRNEDEEDEDEDSETFLNVGSGDESDIAPKDSDENDERESVSSFINRRHSFSSMSSLISPLQHLPQGGTFDYGAYDDSINTYNQFYQHGQQSQSNFNPQSSRGATLSHQHQTSSPEVALVDDQLYCQFQANVAAENMLREPSNVTTEATSAQQQTDEQLCLQLMDLKRGYTRMYKLLTSEVNKANNIIDIQRTRIELLENALRQQQDLKLASQSFVDSNNHNYFPTVCSQQQSEFLQLQTAPSTPVYPHSFNKYPESFMSYDDSVSAPPLQQPQYPVLFSQQKDQLRQRIGSLELSSPCVSNHLTDNWIDPSFQQNTMEATE